MGIGKDAQQLLHDMQMRTGTSSQRGACGYIILPQALHVLLPPLSQAPHALVNFLTRAFCYLHRRGADAACTGRRTGCHAFLR